VNGRHRCQVEVRLTAVACVQGQPPRLGEVRHAGIPGDGIGYIERIGRTRCAAHSAHASSRMQRGCIPRLRMEADKILPRIDAGDLVVPLIVRRGIATYSPAHHTAIRRGRRNEDQRDLRIADRFAGLVEDEPIHHSVRQ